MIETEIRPFVRLWRGDVGWEAAARGGGVQLHGPVHLRRQVPDWLALSHFSAVERPAQPDVIAAG